MSRAFLRALLAVVGWSVPAAAQIPNWELAVLATGQGVRRGVALGQTVGSTSQSPIGGEGWLRLPGIQFGVRYFEFGQAPVSSPTVGPARGTLALGEGLVALGVPGFAVEGGYAVRRVEHLGIGRSLQYARIGARSMFALGGSGGRLGVAGAYVPFVRDPSAASAPEAAGTVIESQLEYRRPRWPVVAIVGYRHEWLRLTPATNLIQIEETGRLVIGLGLAIGR